MDTGQTLPRTRAGFSRRRMLAGTMGAGLVVALGRVIPVGAQQATPAVTSPSAANGPTAPWTTFNLNTITSDQILTIPSAGDKMTHEFPEYRPYISIGQFRQEIGKYVDESVVAGYERYVFVPVDPTQADADTLAQLPGVGADLASDLVKGVPYGSDTAFLQALNGQVSADQLAAIPAWLSSAAQPSVIWTRFNLNTITSEQILTIPGAGDQMTHEFAEYRPYTSIGQFRQEIGKYVDDSAVAGYERYVYVPVDPSQADADTLAQLPGVGADLAGELARNVPYASSDAFLQALNGKVSANQLAAIPAWLATS